MKVRELREAIAEIGEIEAAGSRPELAEGLAELERLFEGHDDESVESFLTSMRESTSPVERDQDVVAGYLTRLERAGQDRVQFEQMFEALSRDPQVRKAEADAIQHGYIGGRAKWPTKREALEAIRKWFMSRRFEEAVLAEVKKSTPW